MIEIYCQHCGHPLKIPNEFAGRAGTCNHCNRAIAVPAAPVDAVASAPVDRGRLIAFVSGIIVISGALSALGAIAFLNRDAAPQRAPDSFTLDADLVARVEKMLPTEDEDRFLQIPWRTDLLLARREANEQGKPLFMWLMNGEPLGCT